jgi:hypothetical protein
MVKKPKNRPYKPYIGLPYMARSGNFPVNRPYMGVGYKLAEPKVTAFSRARFPICSRCALSGSHSKR